MYVKYKEYKEVERLFDRRGGGGGVNLADSSTCAPVKFPWMTCGDVNVSGRLGVVRLPFRGLDVVGVRIGVGMRASTSRRTINARAALKKTCAARNLDCRRSKFKVG